MTSLLFILPHPGCQLTVGISKIVDETDQVRAVRPFLLVEVYVEWASLCVRSIKGDDLCKIPGSECLFLPLYDWTRMYRYR